MAHPAARHEERSGVLVVSFERDANDRANLEIVRQYFANDFFDATNDKQLLVIDLNGVSTLDSSSLSPLVQRLREINEENGKMVLCGINSQGLREILSLTRFDQIFDIYKDADEAIESVTSSV